MKIRIAILEKDQNYLNRIVSVFNTKYIDKFELYSFTEQELAMSALETSRIDVLVADDTFEIDVNMLPGKCAFAYFVDSTGVEQVREQRAICKFQKVELIYKQILSIYAEKAGNISQLKLGEESTRILAFSSVSGGTGASSMAAAAAVHFAASNKKTLYLNLEHFGTSDLFFTGEGQFGMSDIVFALKSRNTNLSLKLESCVKQDVQGVYFYSQAEVALDMCELTVEEILRLLSEVRLTGSYDYIILDLGFSLNRDILQIFHQAHAVVWVGDGSEISNRKVERAYAALLLLEQNEDLPLVNRLYLIYNKFSNKTSRTIDEIGIKNIGGAPRYDHAETMQVVEQLSKMTIFDKIV